MEFHVLTQTLRRLEANGLVTRRSLATAPRGVEYRLTELGKTLLDPVRTLAAWAEANRHCGQPEFVTAFSAAS